MPPLQLPPGSAPIYNTIPNQISAPPRQIQVPLPPPPNTSFPPIPYENLPNSANNYPLPSPPQGQPFVLPSNNGLPNIPLAADRTLPPDETIAIATPSSTALPATPANSNPPNPIIEGNKLPERGKQELLAMRDRMKNNVPPSTATPAPSTPGLSPQKIAAALKRQRSNQPTPPTSSAMSRQEIVTALRENRNSSGELSQETKTALDNLEKFTRQQATIQAQNPDAVTKPPIRRKITTCDRAIDGDVAVVNVVVNPEGERLSEPSLITKTGKPDITQAQNYVKNYEFVKTDTTTNYNFRLEFDYIASKCALAKPNSSPTTNTPEATSNTTTTPTPTSSSSNPIPTSRSTPSTSQPIPTFKPTPASSKPIPKPSPDDSVTPSLQSTTTPQSAPLPIDSSKPSF
jgi:hypothetical protein